MTDAATPPPEGDASKKPDGDQPDGDKKPEGEQQAPSGGDSSADSGSAEQPATPELAAPAASSADSGQPATEREPDAVELAAHSMGHDMLSAIVEEFERLPGHWPKLQQHQQETVIRRTETIIRKLVTAALNTLLRGEHQHVKAVVESVQFKDGIKAVLKIARTEPDRYELAEHVNMPVVVILADPDAYFDRMETIHGQREQRELFPQTPEDAVARMDADAPAGPAEPPPAPSSTPPGIDPEAPPPQAPQDLELERPPVHVQTQALLAEVNVVLTDEEAKALTADQCTEAAYWVQLVKQLGKKAPPAPQFIKLPQGWKPPKKA